MNKNFARNVSSGAIAALILIGGGAEARPRGLGFGEQHPC